MSQSSNFFTCRLGFLTCKGKIAARNTFEEEITVSNKDNIFATPLNQVSDFQFDDAVADVFPDMISRSVPGYPTMIETIGQLAAQYTKSGTNVYDLGCSLGAASFSISRHCKAGHCNIIAVDSSQAMVERCKRKVEAFQLPNSITVKQGLAQSEDINNASMAVMNFTLQFIPPSEREALVKQIYAGLLPGGIFVISEKIRHDDDKGDSLINDLHLNFKRQNGYSELEISQKRAALENVMLIDTFEVHEQRLKEAGFADVVMWYRCFNFMSLVAIK